MIVVACQDQQPCVQGGEENALGTGAAALCVPQSWRPEVAAAAAAPVTACAIAVLVWPAAGVVDVVPPPSSVCRWTVEVLEMVHTGSEAAAIAAVAAAEAAGAAVDVAAGAVAGGGVAAAAAVDWIFVQVH